MTLFRDDDWEARAIEVRIYPSEGGYYCAIYLRSLQVSSVYAATRSAALRHAITGFCDRLEAQEKSRLNFENLFVALMGKYFK